MADREFMIKATLPSQSAFLLKRGKVLVVGEVDEEFVAKAIAAYDEEDRKRRVRVVRLE